MKKITLEDIKIWMDAQLAETQDAGERQEIVDKAKLQAFDLGALDKYARLTKKTQKEFWEEQSQEGYEYKVGRLPEWGIPCADDFGTLEDAYDAGEYSGEETAEWFEENVLPQRLREAKVDFGYAITELERLQTYAEEYKNDFERGEEIIKKHKKDVKMKEKEVEMLEAFIESDERGWGENWWEE